MSTNAGGEASYDDAIDGFLNESVGEAEETEEKAPKEQPKPAKAPAKTADKKTPANKEDDDAEPEDKPKDGPWKSALAKRGIDTPEVNAYMAEEVQPYITRLEQQGGPIAALFEGDQEAASIAAGLLNELGENPAKAVADLITLLDISDEDINALLEGSDEGPDDDVQPPVEDDPENETPEQRWVRERMEREEQESHAEAYDTFMKTVAEEFGEGFDETLFSMAVAASGSIEGAMEMYPALADKYGKPAAPKAPPVMGRRSGGQAPQPIEKTYDGSNSGWESAFDDLFAEEKAKKGR